MAKNATVDTPVAAYLEMQKRFDLPMALMGGTLSMREQGRTYLPQFSKEDDKIWVTRNEQAVLYDAYGETVRTYAARPFGKPVGFGEDTDPFYLGMQDNIDLTGRSLSVLARELFEDLLIFGKCHILVDYPNTGQLGTQLGRELTLEDERDFKIRAYFLRISPSDLIGWSGVRIHSEERLSHIRYRSRTTVTPAGNPWGEEVQDRVRVWTRDVIQDHLRDAEKDEFVLEDEVSNTLGAIPLITIYANRKGLLTSWPTLEPLAHLNAKHWRNSSDQDNIETVARVPLLFGQGFSEQELSAIQIGPYRVIGNKSDRSDFKVVETSGQAVSVGQNALDRLEKQMDSLSLAPLLRRPGNITATEIATEADHNVSDLEAYVMLMEAGLSQAFHVAAAWHGWELEPPTIIIDQDLGFDPAGGDELKELREDFALGALDHRTYLAERKRRGLYSEDMDIDEVINNTELDEGADLEAAA
jgi:hypothetical protein